MSHLAVAFDQHRLRCVRCKKRWPVTDTPPTTCQEPKP